jgi:signal transduction histidine kinase
MRPRHWTAIDMAIGGVLGLAGVATDVHDVVTLPSRLLLVAAIAVPVGLRRRIPLSAFCALAGLAVFTTAVGWALPAGPAFIWSTAAYVLFVLTATARRLVGVVALAVALLMIVVPPFLVHLHQIPAGRGGGSDWAVAAFALIISWMTGYSVRQRRLYARMLQQEAASNAVAGERLRIARELHDIVAHSMSVIAVQAGYGQYVIDTSPGDARDALGAIQATSRDALEEMRRMLGVLRQPDRQEVPVPEPDHERPEPDAEPDRTPAALLAPAPGLDDLGRLIERTRGVGVTVSVEWSGQARSLPAGVGLSAYRIIQEALTNVVKHAGDGAACRVRLNYDEAALHLLVTDDGGRQLVAAANVPAAAGSGSGHGLVGMRERALLCGGDVTAGPRPDGGFQVTATLPLTGGTT